MFWKYLLGNTVPSREGFNKKKSKKGNSTKVKSGKVKSGKVKPGKVKHGTKQVMTGQFDIDQPVSGQVWTTPVGTV